jgi:hypothetical protein
MRIWKWCWFIGALIVLALPAWGQDAVYKRLSDTDAAEAKAAYDQLQAAQKKWDDVQTKIQDVYLNQAHPKFDQSDGHPLNGAVSMSINGVVDEPWQFGFTFSKDFKIIVPKARTTAGTLTIGGSQYWYPCGGIGMAPASSSGPVINTPVFIDGGSSTTAKITGSLQ